MRPALTLHNHDARAGRQHSHHPQGPGVGFPLRFCASASWPFIVAGDRGGVGMMGPLGNLCTKQVVILNGVCGVKNPEKGIMKTKDGWDSSLRSELQNGPRAEVP
jgi:hypothetical protein